MKALLRHPAVQAAISALAAGYLKLVFATMRFDHEDIEKLTAGRAQGRGMVICFWHAGIPISTQAWEHGKPGWQEMRALISRSIDGALIAGVMDRLGVPAIRGSKAQDASRTREKGGSEALRDMVRWVKSGGAVAVTPDGPRGPARSMGEGPGLVARLSGGCVMVMGAAVSPALRVNSWDRMYIPLPFGRCAFVWDGPFEAKAGDDLDALSAQWKAALDRATDRAEALVA